MRATVLGKYIESKFVEGKKKAHQELVSLPLMCLHVTLRRQTSIVVTTRR